MNQTKKSSQFSQQLQSIRNAQKKIREKIGHIKKQLKRLESLPSSQPWVSFRRVQTVKELKSNLPTLKEVLKNDLKVLTSELHELGREGINVQVRAADAASKDFNKELEKALKAAEKDGSLSGENLADLRFKAESVVKKYVDILRAAPSEKNMERVLDSLETPLLLGSSTESGVCGDALQAVARASEKIVAQKEKAFRNNPTADNFDKLLQSQGTASFVGGKTRLQPANWKPARTSHRVVTGDTLSKLAKRYYGKMSHWDLIYIENYGIIGDDVKKLRVGITLKIP
jgi:LysM repeat protein